MLRNKKLNPVWGVFLQAFFWLSPAGAEPKNPDAAVLVNMVLNNPTQAYQGHMMVSYWGDNASTAEDVKVYFSPPNKYRFEFLAPNGTVDRVVMSNGLREEVQLMENDRISENYSKNHRPSLLTSEEERTLLLTNYKAILKESEMVLGRPTWTIELVPLIDGKPRRLIRIDRETKVILEIKHYMPEGKTGSWARFTKFESGAKMTSGLFLSDVVNGKDAGADLAAASASDATAELPSKLYGGFSLEGGDQFEVSGKAVQHCWYTDGLLPVSIFHTPVPVKAPSNGQSLVEWTRPLRMGSSSAGNVYQWEKNKEYYTLIGDVQQDLLREIAGNIK